MHAASEDLRICRFQTGKVPARVFDVQIAAGFVGFGYPLSLGNLVSQTLGESVFGGETRTDWRRRPLSPAQLRYALDDVRYLLPLADLLDARLAELGPRGVGRGGVPRLPRRHPEPRRGVALAAALGPAPVQPPGPGGRAAALATGGPRRPGGTNRPLRQVLRDDLLVAIAKRQPASRQELEALRDFNRPHLLSKSAEILAPGRRRRRPSPPSNSPSTPSGTTTGRA